MFLKLVIAPVSHDPSLSIGPLRLLSRVLEVGVRSSRQQLRMFLIYKQSFFHMWHEIRLQRIDYILLVNLFIDTQVQVIRMMCLSRSVTFSLKFSLTITFLSLMPRWIGQVFNASPVNVLEPSASLLDCRSVIAERKVWNRTLLLV